MSPLLIPLIFFIIAFSNEYKYNHDDQSGQVIHKIYIIKKHKKVVVHKKNKLTLREIHK